MDAWGVAHEIDDTTWTQAYPGYPADIYHLTQYSNAERWAVAENDAGNAFNAGLYSRFDWAEDGGEIYYCQTVYDASTETDALAATPADSADLAAGCGGFSWTHLTP